MRKEILCLTLLLCLVLTACQKSDEPQQQSQVSLSDASAAIEEEQVLLSVDGREVPAWRYFYWLRQTCERVCASYAASGTEVDWTAASEEETLADYVKAQALADTVLYATVENWAEQYGCTATVSDSVEAETWLTAEQARELERVGRLYAALYEWFCREESPLFAEEETLEAFAEETGWVGYREILIPFGAEREAAEQKAAEVFAALNRPQGKEADLSALTGDGIDISREHTLQLGSGDLPPEKEAVLAGLSAGQFSGIVETEDGYAVLQRITPATDIVREALFDHLLLEAAAKAEIRCIPAYRELDPAEFWAETQKGANDSANSLGG